ncbi:hypothetical protein P5673_012626 [Acropora cervicornis]|uniref:Uncharacterized protein n=1 Tax=Acropora cervicornis TaxID=6130 RepID=A0AAD9V7A4_ACRCE|nr:hypothetical protein P5673_012626 [Acropora cervicornis]
MDQQNISKLLRIGFYTIREVFIWLECEGVPWPVIPLCGAPRQIFQQSFKAWRYLGNLQQYTNGLIAEFKHKSRDNATSISWKVTDR